MGSTSIRSPIGYVCETLFGISVFFRSTDVALCSFGATGTHGAVPTHSRISLIRTLIANLLCCRLRVGAHLAVARQNDRIPIDETNYGSHRLKIRLCPQRGQAICPVPILPDCSPSCSGLARLLQCSRMTGPKDAPLTLRRIILTRRRGRCEAAAVTAVGVALSRLVGPFFKASVGMGHEERHEAFHLSPTFRHPLNGFEHFRRKPPKVGLSDVLLLLSC